MKQKIKRRAKQILALLLVAVMFIGECSTGYAAEQRDEILSSEEAGFQEETGSEDVMQETVEQEMVAQEPGPQVLFELEELREESVKQFRLSDGTILAAQYGMDVHYETEEGVLAEIDNRFLYEAAETEEDFSGYSTAEGTVEYKFAPQSGAGEILRLSEGGYSVGFELMLPQQESPETEQPAVTEEPEVTVIVETTAEPEATATPEVTATPEATVTAEVTAIPDATLLPELTVVPMETLEVMPLISPEIVELTEKPAESDTGAVVRWKDLSER